MNRSLLHRFLFSSLLFGLSAGAVACADVEDSGPSSDRADQTCPLADELIALARATIDPELSYGPGSTGTIDDLNGDEIDDRVVMPGLGVSGANTEMSIFLSRDGCVRDFSTSFAGVVDVSPTEDGTMNNGLRNLETRSQNGYCAIEVATYEFDGSGYVLNPSLDRKINLCECMSDEELIGLAREELRKEGGDYATDDFADGSGVEPTRDLNGDGYDDFAVRPGIAYSGAVAEMVIYMSDPTGCASDYAGSLGGVSDVTATEDGAVTNGVRNLRTVNHGACIDYFNSFTWGGTKYQLGTSKEVKSCDD